GLNDAARCGVDRIIVRRSVVEYAHAERVALRLRRAAEVGNRDADLAEIGARTALELHRSRVAGTVQIRVLITERTVEALARDTARISETDVGRGGALLGDLPHERHFLRFLRIRTFFNIRIHL